MKDCNRERKARHAAVLFADAGWRIVRIDAREITTTGPNEARISDAHAVIDVAYVNSAVLAGCQIGPQ
jgi:hypothetical protein